MNKYTSIEESRGAYKKAALSMGAGVGVFVTTAYSIFVFPELWGSAYFIPSAEALDSIIFLDTLRYAIGFLFFVVFILSQPPNVNVLSKLSERKVTRKDASTLFHESSIGAVDEKGPMKAQGKVVKNIMSWARATMPVALLLLFAGGTLPSLANFDASLAAITGLVVAFAVAVWGIGWMGISDILRRREGARELVGKLEP